MGACIYCGNKAGLFKDRHKECEEKKHAGEVQLEKAVVDAIQYDQNLDELPGFLDAISKECYISEAEKQQLIYKGFDTAVALFNEDSIITAEEEAKLATFINHFKYTQEELNGNHSHDLVAKSSIVRRLALGEDVEIGRPDGFVLPIQLGKDEKLLWAFARTSLYQPSTKTTYSGHSSGVSVRIASGLYYRMGAFKGEPIVTSEMKFIASGITFYTTTSIYFSSPMKTVKIPFNKIISLFPYGNGVSIQKDGATSKPFIFQNVDAPFLQNIMANVKDH